MLKEKTFLYNGLPSIRFRSKYIVFSPYSNKIATLTKDEIKNISIKRKLQRLGFFGRPNFSYDKDIARVTLITTTNCNLRCVYCFARGGERATYMDPELAIRVIKKVISPETKEIHLNFFGGEPSLNFKCIKESVNFINRKYIKARYQITTNGVMPEDTLDFLIKNNFIFFLSIDGTPEIQNKQRPMANGNPTNDIVEKTAKKIIENDGNVKFRVTITRYSMNKMHDIIEYLYGLGAKYIHFEPLHVSGRAYKKFKLQPDAKKYIEEFIKALDLAKECKIKLIDSSYNYLLNPCIQFCPSVQKNKLILTSEGKITFCLEAQDDCHTLSDIFIVGEYDTKKDRFEYDKNKMEKLTGYTVNSVKKCEKCFAKYACGGGCIVRNLIENKDFQKPNNYYCQIRKHLLYDAIIRIWKESN